MNTFMSHNYPHDRVASATPQPKEFAMNTTNRRGRGITTVVLAGALSLLSMPASLAAPPAPDPENPGVTTDTTGCIPSNDLLSGPLNKPIVDVIGAVGGIFPALALGVIFLFLALAAVFAKNKKGEKLLQNAAFTVAVVLAIPAVLLLVSALTAWMGGLCTGLWD